MTPNLGDWRAAIAAENERLGIRSIPARPMLGASREPTPAPDATPMLGASKWNPPQAGRGKHQAGSMNKLETRYAQHLELRRMVGEIRRWTFEPMKLRIAVRTFYTPDFLVVLADGMLELHEVKGHWEDDARVKIKAAARLFPEIQFVAITRPRKLKDWKFEYLKRPLEVPPQ
jgi:hypothetical protein